jgi:DNA-binding NtrC family response regulator
VRKFPLAPVSFLRKTFFVCAAMISRLLAKLADIVLSEVPADRALILALDAKGDKVFERSKGLDAGEPGAIDRTIIGRALDSGRPMLAPDPVLEAPLLDLGPSGDGAAPSVLCLPLKLKARPSGFVYMARARDGPVFSRRDLEFVTLTLSPALLIMAGDGEAAPGAGLDLATGRGAGGSPFLGRTASILRVRSMIERLRDSDAPVFIWGESGTGKELAARTLHDTGRRKAGQFVAVNCGAIPENLLESELFGHARGAFTGALRDKPGLVEEAHGGTFFLDEIGDLPLPLQAKLLRVLEEKRIRRVGETRTRPVDVRFVSATHKDIDREVAAGAFREDLYYRLKIISLELPNLRERKEDIPPLVNHFLDEFSRSMGRPRPLLSPLAMELLTAYAWPGNVRELQNEVQRCLIMAGESPVIGEDILSPKVNPRGETFAPACRGFLAARAEFEKRFLREALARCNYRKSRTAAEIGLTRQGLFKLLKKHSLGGNEPSSPLGSLPGGGDLC